MGMFAFTALAERGADTPPHPVLADRLAPPLDWHSIGAAKVQGMSDRQSQRFHKFDALVSYADHICVMA